MGNRMRARARMPLLFRARARAMAFGHARGQEHSEKFFFIALTYFILPWFSIYLSDKLNPFILD